MATTNEYELVDYVLSQVEKKGMSAVREALGAISEEVLNDGSDVPLVHLLCLAIEGVE